MNDHHPHWMLAGVAEETAPRSTVDLWPRIKRAALQKQASHRRSANRSRRFGFAMLVVILPLVLAMVLSPAVRAQVQTWVGAIGGQMFTTSGDYPGDDEPVTTVANESLSLAEARETPGMAIDLPSWVPAGFVLQDPVSVLQLGDGVTRVEITWSSPENGAILLNIEQYPAGSESNWLVSPESIEEVLVDGEPAALVRGAWNANAKQWDHMDFLSLYWKSGVQNYILRGLGGQISAETLIRMAESIP
ncbi:hypothetical protein LARV_01149 [Longilinea arvoryzae]|uniref:DUF4367 domain-containing protein n=1 Tax=Longilinea arvoryzae TaxID=360412 RepID=A0A0S7BFM3_9CHLR|nr:hypothetical protein [Longilinea arvoryzae]GAP13395.1 hypothetical protein LARV_01149 [Longilinea arvoryzae]